MPGAYQTEIQQRRTLRFGSAKIEEGDTEASLTDLGIATGVEFSENFTLVSIKPDNAQEEPIGEKDHTASAKFDLFEINFANLAALRGGHDHFETVAGTPVDIVDEAHTLTGIATARLNHRNGDGTVVTSIVVTDASGNAAVQNVDYVITLDSMGWTNIARVAASTVISTGEGVKVSYHYTPNAANIFSSGGYYQITPKVIRLTNKDVNGKLFQITIYKATIQKGIDIKFPADEATEPAKLNIEMKGLKNTSRTVGDQLYKIYDEQGVYV